MKPRTLGYTKQSHIPVYPKWALYEPKMLVGTKCKIWFGSKSSDTAASTRKGDSCHFGMLMKTNENLLNHTYTLPELYQKLLIELKKRLGYAGGYAKISNYSNDTNCKKLMLAGDVELNPGPTSYEAHRSAIGCFYVIAKKLFTKCQKLR